MRLQSRSLQPSEVLTVAGGSPSKVGVPCRRSSCSWLLARLSPFLVRLPPTVLFGYPLAPPGLSVSEWPEKARRRSQGLLFFICPFSFFLFFCSCCAAWETPVTWPGIEPVPLANWNRGVLTTEPPEKSLNVFYYLALGTTFHHFCSTLMIAQVSPT